MTLNKPIFENLVQTKALTKPKPRKKATLKVELKPLIPQEFPVNMNMISPRFELITQTYGRGDGITIMWVYVKAHDGTCTDFHCETHGQGGVNLFCGTGHAGWLAISPKDYGQVRKLFVGEY